MKEKKVQNVEMTANELALFEAFKEWKEVNADSRNIKEQTVVNKLIHNLADEIDEVITDESNWDLFSEVIHEKIAIWAIGEYILECTGNLGDAKSDIDSFLEVLKEGVLYRIANIEANEILGSDEEVELVYREYIDQIKHKIKDVCEELDISGANDVYFNIAEWLMSEYGRKES